MKIRRFGSRRRGGSGAKRQACPCVEALEARALLARAGPVARLAAMANPALPTVDLFASTARPRVGQQVTLLALVLPGSVEEKPVSYEFQERFGRNLPWVDIATPSARNAVTFRITRSGPVQFRALAKVLVDADQAFDSDESPDGFQDVVDFSNSPVNPYVLGSRAPFASVDMLLQFKTRTVAMLAAADNENPPPKISDSLTVTANVPIFVKNGKIEEYVKPKEPLFDETLDDSKPEGAKLGNGLLMRPAIKISRWRVSVGKDREKKEKAIAKALGTDTPNENAAVFLTDKNGDIDDIIILENFPGQNVDTIEIAMYSAGAKGPIELVDPTPENGFPLVPKKRAMVKEDKGNDQDITQELFPNYYDKNGKLKLKDFPPPFKVVVMSQ